MMETGAILVGLSEAKLPGKLPETFLICSNIPLVYESFSCQLISVYDPMNGGAVYLPAGSLLAVDSDLM